MTDKECLDCNHHKNGRCDTWCEYGEEWTPLNKNGWIKIISGKKDSYPNTDKDVLCYRGYHIGGMKDVYRYKGNDVWEDAYGYWQTTEDDGITHWMELPPDPYL